MIGPVVSTVARSTARKNIEKKADPGLAYLRKEKVRG